MLTYQKILDVLQDSEAKTCESDWFLLWELLTADVPPNQSS